MAYGAYGDRSRIWALVLAIFLVFPFLSWATVRTVKSIVFNIEVSGHLKRAADANTIDLAKQELKVVMTFIEKERLTDGYTSILYKTPDEDIGFWYQNLKSSLDELYALGATATQLEKSNVLIKLRETLLDQGEKSVKVTIPDGISIFPNNIIYMIWGWLSFVVFVGAIALFIYWISQY